MATCGIPCRFFGSTLGCRFGDRCKFVHDAATVSSGGAHTPRCRFYRTPKGCRYGELCRFQHDDEATCLELELKDKQIKGLSIPHVTVNVDSIEKEEGCHRADCHETFENLVVHLENDPVDEVEEDGLEVKEEYPTDDVDGEDDDYDHAEEAEEEEHDNEAEDLDESTEEVERKKPDINKATCGECSSVFLGADAFHMLKDHYMEMFMKFNHTHLAFLQTDIIFNVTTFCVVCDKMFACSKDLLRHTVDKSKRTDSDGDEHRIIIETGLVKPFCYRDTVYYDEDRLIDELLSTLHNDPLMSDDDDTDEDSDEDEDFMGSLPLGLLLMGSHGHSLLGSYDDDDDNSDDGGMYGFSEDDCFELLCQGIKPWDPEAGEALAVLNGWI